MFPEGKQHVMTLHQDTASSHTSEHTVNFLKDQNIKFITPEEYLPTSPDAAPIDFGICRILKRRLQKRQVNLLSGLKRALKDEWRKLEQTTIYKALKS
ncbi:hypothetical protein DPMN_131809 [Dreissena polymorpha]|uniref:Transposase n=1 Tax=Dreissena polymorpha TaxID=45954 RepID=A0A9D4FUZ8_DREPO|nr:hypothetical protein DPMN_131809 [Dreissena polymorpha]